MASVRVIRCAMTVCATTKVCEVATKVQIEAIITRKFYAEIRANSISGADVLGPVGAVGTRGGDGAVGACGICMGAGAGADGTGMCGS